MRYFRNLVKQVIEIVSFSAFNRAPETGSLCCRGEVATLVLMCSPTNISSIELLAYCLFCRLKLFGIQRLIGPVGL
jgi:hypothetical protein